MSPFKKRVIQIVRAVPQGKVVSYGQVASYCGLPRAARQVGWILNSTEGSPIDLPWWRVVNNHGYLSIRGTTLQDKQLQKKLLEAEGVLFSEEFTLPMEQYRYRPTKKELKTFQLEDKYMQFLLEKYGV